MTDRREEMEALIRPIARFLQKTLDRVPFCNWFDTVTARQAGFQNRAVQGGLFCLTSFRGTKAPPDPNGLNGLQDVRPFLLPN